jgi:hypothetical protein
MRTLTLSILALMALAIVPPAAAQENDASSFRKAYIRIQRQKAFRAWRETNAPRMAQMSKAELRQMRHEKLSYRRDQTSARKVRQDGSTAMGPNASATPRAWAKSDKRAKSAFGKRQWVAKANKKGGKAQRKASSVWSKQGRRAAKTKDRKTTDRSQGAQPPRRKAGKVRKAAEAQPAKRTAEAKSRDASQRQNASEPVGVKTKAKRNPNAVRRAQAEQSINDTIRSNTKVAKASTRKLMRTRQWSSKARESTTAKKAAMFRARHDRRIGGDQANTNDNADIKANNQAQSAHRRNIRNANRNQASADIRAKLTSPAIPMGLPAPNPTETANPKEAKVEKRVQNAGSALLSAPPPSQDDDQ